MTTALIALGGNQGEVSQTFQQAVSALEQLPCVTVLAVSQLYETTPVGNDAGERYINAAAKIECTLSPEGLLLELQRIETKLGRKRTTHWGPRTLDLDVIGIEDQIINTHQLTVPHPACWYRRFVLDPLVEIAPLWQHPVLLKTTEQLRHRLLERPLPVCIEDHFKIDPMAFEAAFQDFQVTFTTPEEAVITFANESPPYPPRTIAVPANSDPIPFIQQALTAIFDEPLVK